MTKVYIGFGSNKGNVLKNLQSAVNLINCDNRIEITDISSLYETKPYGSVPQDNFINGALSLNTDYNLNELFVFLKDVEKKVGRTPSERWGPREIDLDILLFGDLVQQEGEVIIPHKGIVYRDFVIKPLLDLDENIIIPGMDKQLNAIDISILEKNVLNKLSENISF